MKHQSYKNFNRLQDWSREDIEKLLDTCFLLKDAETKGVRVPLLKDMSLGMFFDQASTRTRVSFETAMTQLGGHALFLDANALHAGSGQETVKETAAIISSMVDAIMIRNQSQAVIDQFEANSTVPVINAMSCFGFDKILEETKAGRAVDQHHPSQVIADIITMIERKPAGKKLSDCTYMWVGCGSDGFDPVLNDHMDILTELGMRVVVACPEEYSPSEERLARSGKIAEENGGELIVTHDPYEYIADADFIYTGVINYHKQGIKEDEAFKVFYPKFQINEELMAKAKPTAWVMHYLPGNRNWEITDAVWDGPQSALLPQGENRLYAQRGILCTLLYPLRYTPGKGLVEYYAGKIEDQLTDSFHNYDF